METIKGKIPNNVGFRNVNGSVRKLTVKDKLQQVVNLKGVTTINHPMLGSISVDRDRAINLLSSNISEGELIRYKANMFLNESS